MSIAKKFEVIADEVYDKAVSDEREKLTKAITDNGARVSFTYAFAYGNWSGFKFSNPIQPTSACNHMFYGAYEMTELPSPIDFSKIATATNMNYDTNAYRRSVFGYCRNLEFVPDLNMRAIGGLEEWFVQCYKLHTIELLRVKRETIYSNTFNSCDKLTEIRFDGEIGQNISFASSPLLSDASLVNIAEHMINTNATITLHSTVKSRINGTPIYDAITGKGWTIV